MKSSPATDDHLTVGQLADRFGLATHVLRHWEDMGLIEPATRLNGRRRYGEAHVARVTMILRAKQAGLTLRQIGEMLAAPGRDERQAILERHRETLDEQIERIQAARAMLDHALDCHAADFTTCADFQAVARAAAPHRA